LSDFAGVVLAAGLTRRMGRRNKLLAEIDGTPMVRRVVDTALAAGLDPVVVVVGHQADEVRGALGGLPVAFRANDNPEAGLGGSLRVGIGALLTSADRSGAADPSGCHIRAATVFLGDMPWVEPRAVSALMTAFDTAGRHEICVPVHDGRRGNPVLWGRRFFTDLAAIEGDVGGRVLLERQAACVHEVPVQCDGVLRDVDTPEELLAVDTTG
jgi:molybdenum cofactor cytidylyltransferase